MIIVNSNRSSNGTVLPRMFKDSTKMAIMLMSQPLNKSKIACFTDEDR